MNCTASQTASPSTSQRFCVCVLRMIHVYLQAKLGGRVRVGTMGGNRDLIKERKKMKEAKVRGQNEVKEGGWLL